MFSWPDSTKHLKKFRVIELIVSQLHNLIFFRKLFSNLKENFLFDLLKFFRHYYEKSISLMYWIWLIVDRCFFHWEVFQINEVQIFTQAKLYLTVFDTTSLRSVKWFRFWRFFKLTLLRFPKILKQQTKKFCTNPGGSSRLRENFWPMVDWIEIQSFFRNRPMIVSKIDGRRLLFRLGCLDLTFGQFYPVLARWCIMPMNLHSCCIVESTENRLMISRVLSIINRI